MEIKNKFQVLLKIAKVLNENCITWAVGGSLLLYFEGKSNIFHDIDIMVVENDAEKLKEILLNMGELQPPNPNINYKTKYFFEFVIDGVDVDVMGGFVIVKDDVLYDVSLEKYGVKKYKNLYGEKIPLQSLEDWKSFYELMNRAQKVKMITGEV